ncbi:MAG: FG-GAP-like repeat-containing protein [Thermoanaerobaculia bacterium]|nr:FG-GAP-like repeat-containing protein [Thermoanaerobaculia bacterium]
MPEDMSFVPSLDSLSPYRRRYCIPRICFGACVLLAGAAIAEDARYFRDVAEEAGVALEHRTRSFDNPYAHIMEGYTALGASVAVADVDLDGLEDVFVTDSSLDGRNLLWRNISSPDGLRFVDVAGTAQVAVGNDARNASADSLFFDMDNDGDPDLLVIRFGQSLLFENLAERYPPGSGTVRFRDVTSRSGMKPYLNSISAIAFDYDQDRDLDLFLANYFAPVNLFDPETPRFFPESFEEAENGGGVTLLRNDGVFEGVVRFSDVTREAGLGSYTGWSLDLGHADIDQDGDEDLFVAADFGTDRLYLNNGFGRFIDVTERVLGLDTKKGMNAEWGDFDGNGTFDLYVTNITDEYMNEGNFLWQNLTPAGSDPSGLAFADVARETGTHDTGWGWAGKFFDYDNDGNLDLYVTNGWVSGNDENYVLDVFELITSPDVDLADARVWPPMGEKTLSGYQRNSLFHNRGGLFVDEAARHGVDSQLDGRGVAVADLDQDGRQDLFVTNAGAAPLLYQNVMPRESDGGPHWLQLRLEGVASNRDAVGARVEVEQTTAAGAVRRLVRFVDGGNGFASQSSRTLHFGLGGQTDPVRVRIHWPSGASEEHKDVAVNRIYDLKEQGGLRPRTPESGGPDRSAQKVEDASSKAATGPQPPRPGAAGKAPAPPSAGRGVDVPASVLPTPELSAERHHELARGANARGDVGSALHHYELALTAKPGNLRWGSEHRQVAIDAEEYRRSLGFWKGLAEAHPEDPDVRLNLGFAHVDKIPSEGAVTQVILANQANQHLARAIELMEGQGDPRTLESKERLWLAYYSRGNSLMYWPAIFGRTKAGIEDLQRALELAEQIEPVEAASGATAGPAFRGRAWAALGDGYWRLDERNTMREIWRRGIDRYPDSVPLRQRLDRQGAELDRYLDEIYDPRTRVATHLREIWRWHDER